MKRGQFGLYAFVAACLIIIAGIALASSPVTEDTSSRGAARAGTAALYDYFTNLGLPTRRMENVFSIAPGDGTVVIVGPTAEYNAADAQQLVTFVRNGGHLILATSSPTEVAPVLQAFGVQIYSLSSAMSAQPAAELSGAQPPVSTVALSGNAFVLHARGARSLLSTSAGDVGVDISEGSGTFTLIGDALALNNDGLRQRDDAPFAVALTRTDSTGTIAFDDVHHQADTRDPQAVIFQSPLGAGLLIFSLVLVLGLISNGRSLGRPVPAGDPGRVPSADDYVRAMGQLFERSSDHGGVALRYHDDLKARLGAMYGVDPRIEDAIFSATIGEYDPGLQEQLAALLVRSRDLAGRRPGAAAVTALAREIDSFERQIAQPLPQ